MRYQATVRPTGAATAFVSPAEGEVVVEGWKDRRPERYRVSVETAGDGDEAPPRRATKASARRPLARARG